MELEEGKKMEEVPQVEVIDLESPPRKLQKMDVVPSVVDLTQETDPISSQITVLLLSSEDEESEHEVIELFSTDEDDNGKEGAIVSPIATERIPKWIKMKMGGQCCSIEGLNILYELLEASLKCMREEDDYCTQEASKQRLGELLKNEYHELVSRKSKAQKEIEKLESRMKDVEKVKASLRLQTFIRPFKDNIFVCNDVDDEQMPNFQYIVDNNYGNIELSRFPPFQACICEKCSSTSNCCAHIMGEQFPYFKTNELRIKPGFGIYECSEKCKCDSSCPSRVVQKGSKVKFLVYKTNDGRGWGLKSLEDIMPRQFVIEYVGQVSRSEDAYSGGYNPYIFHLDFYESKYVIDAREQGNVARFLNHCCSSNLRAMCAWISHRNKSLPRIAFFSKHFIKKGQELTINYGTAFNSDKPSTSKAPFTPQTPISREGLVLHTIMRTPCLCGARNCKKLL